MASNSQKEGMPGAGNERRRCERKLNFVQRWSTVRAEEEVYEAKPHRSEGKERERREKREREREGGRERR